MPRHLRASGYEAFFMKVGLVEGRRPRKAGEKGRQVYNGDIVRSGSTAVCAHPPPHVGLQLPEHMSALQHVLADRTAN